MWGECFWSIFLARGSVAKTYLIVIKKYFCQPSCCDWVGWLFFSDVPQPVYFQLLSTWPEYMHLFLSWCSKCGCWGGGLLWSSVLIFFQVHSSTFWTSWSNALKIHFLKPSLRFHWKYFIVYVITPSSSRSLNNLYPIRMCFYRKSWLLDQLNYTMCSRRICYHKTA